MYALLVPKNALASSQYTDIGSLGGQPTYARDLNNVGQVVGYSTNSSGQQRAFLWDNGVMTNLGTLPGYDTSQAWGINDSGKVVGTSSIGGITHAFLWDNGVMTDLGTLGGDQTWPKAVNNNGQVVGYSTNSSGQHRAFLWNNGVMTDLGTLDPSGSGTSEANDINNLGRIVGNSNGGAFLWQNGVMTDLGLTTATSINNSGAIVGTNSTGGVLWQNGVVQAACAGSSINDNNEILCGNSLWKDNFLYEVRIPGKIYWSELYRKCSSPGDIPYERNIGISAMNNSRQMIGSGIIWPSTNTAAYFISNAGADLTLHSSHDPYTISPFAFGWSWMNYLPEVCWSSSLTRSCQVSPLGLTGTEGGYGRIMPSAVSYRSADITLTCDGIDGPVSDSVRLIVTPSRPYIEITPRPPYLNEGDMYVGSGLFTDEFTAITDAFPDIAPTSWTATVDWADGSGIEPITLDGQNFTLSHVIKDGSNETEQIIITVTNAEGGVGTMNLWITLYNSPPSIEGITVPNDPVPVNTTVEVSGSFTDRGVLDTHTASWNWGDDTTSAGTVTEADGSGTVTDSHTYTADGQYTIALTVTDKDGATAQGSTTVTVGRVLTILNPAQVWVGLKNSDDVGTKFDLMAEVYKDGALVTSGEVDGVVGGSSGFNNAKLDTITFNPFSPIGFPAGSVLSMKLYVRNTCSGHTHNSGTARLWYNDASANSQFGATIGENISNYYLLNNFLLGTSAGAGPKKTIDVQAGAPCSAFKTFGTWTITP